MNNDVELANLLGEAPPDRPDPGFRFDVFARLSERARRRAALDRAFRRLAVFAVLGAAFPIAQAAGLTLQAAQPVLLSVGLLALAWALALLTIAGPRGVLAYSRAALRAASLRA